MENVWEKLVHQDIIDIKKASSGKKCDFYSESLLFLENIGFILNPFLTQDRKKNECKDRFCATDSPAKPLGKG